MEDFLSARGFTNYRARHHDKILRLELEGNQMKRILQDDILKPCLSFAKELGFAYVTLDLEGFRSGSMNEVLEET